MTLLDRKQILGMPDLKTVDVAVPEWGGTVRLRAWTGAQRDAFEASCMAPVNEDGTRGTRNLANLRARTVASSAVDEQGQPLFSAEDVAALGEKCGVALDRLFDACQQLHGLSDRDVKALEGNSTAAPSGSSPSTSPSSSGSRT